MHIWHGSNDIRMFYNISNVIRKFIKQVRNKSNGKILMTFHFTIEIRPLKPPLPRLGLAERVTRYNIIKPSCFILVDSE